MLNSSWCAASSELMKVSEVKVLPCPRCGEPVTWNHEARWKPFCSERCKMVDLGAWFMEEHVIPGKPAEHEPGKPRDDDDAD